MHDSTQELPGALEVRILRFIYEHGPSSLDDFHERSGYRVESHSHHSAVEGFRDAAQKGFIDIDEVKKTASGSTIRYKAAIEARKLRSLLVRNAANAAFVAETEEFRELMAEFARLPRE
jgi:hypothetical protein